MSAAAESADDGEDSTDREVIWWSSCPWYVTDKEDGLVRLERARDVNALRQEGDAVWLPADAIDC